MEADIFFKRFERGRTRREQQRLYRCDSEFWRASPVRWCASDRMSSGGTASLRSGRASVGCASRFRSRRALRQWRSWPAPFNPGLTQAQAADWSQRKMQRCGSGADTRGARHRLAQRASSLLRTSTSGEVAFPNSAEEKGAGAEDAFSARLHNSRASDQCDAECGALESRPSDPG